MNSSRDHLLQKYNLTRLNMCIVAENDSSDNDTNIPKVCGGWKYTSNQFRKIHIPKPSMSLAVKQHSQYLSFKHRCPGKCKNNNNVTYTLSETQGLNNQQNVIMM
jgi:hypothetical protein